MVFNNPKMGGHYIPQLRCADDTIVVLSTSPEGHEKFKTIIEENYEIENLFLNAKETK